MNYLGQDFFNKLNLVNAVGMFLFIIFFFILQHIFDREFVCSCRPNIHVNRIIYMVFPPVIPTWVAYITEPFHRARISSIPQIFRCNETICFFVELFINYVCLGGLWIAAVLLDGDWFICLMTKLNSNQTGIPCKKDLTYEENQILAGYKIDSLDLGLGLICSLIIVWSITESLIAYCNRERTWKRGSRSDMLFPPHYRKVYERLLEKQVSKHLKEELTKIAEARAKAICKPHLRTIGENEQPPNNGGDGNNSINNTVLEAWKKISTRDFSFSSIESHVGAESAAENPAPEGGAAEAPEAGAAEDPAPEGGAAEAPEAGAAEDPAPADMDSGITSSDSHLMT